MISPLYRRLFPFISLLMRTSFRIFVPRYRVSGRHNIPYRGPVIFAPNHVSDADPPLVGMALRFPITYMAKRELWEIEWLGPIMTFLGAFPVDPASSDRAALKLATEILKQGDGLALFPEGKISHDGKLDEILPGAVLLALKSGAPVIPVGIWGAQEVMPYGQTRPRISWKPMRIHFGEPLHFEDLEELPSRQGRVLATQRLETAMRAAIVVAQSG